MRARLSAILLVICLFAVATASAQDEKRVQAARDILKNHQEAVVGVSAVMKIQQPGYRDYENKAELLGTVIHPSGLTVVSLGQIDPASAQGPETGAKTKLTDIKIRLADNTEIPAKLVLKDPDLDLGFLMPEQEEGKEAPKLKWIKLEQSDDPKPLDEVIVMARLHKALDRQPAVSLGRISAVVTKPRTFYVYDILGDEHLGVPAFRLDGGALGICLLRKAPVKGQIRPIAAIILPAADVMEIAQQALTKKSE